ncbi:uncharacterized protein wu:fa19b12 [Notolabrus celidotus]|uniref:uncharacterized protein wu:fa19b12 n=1 Tax=Notolabrus celidotus TaxID=1203425 RepID=UPI00148FB806|nr:uncharacterized protein wu:fa19b12 [Notolabrus celidotus]
MAKRRTEDGLLQHDPPSKKCRPLCSVDMQLGGMAPSVDVSPPSLLDLLGSRCRKRTHFFEDLEKQEDEVALCLKPTHCEARKHAVHVSTSGSFQERRSPGTLTSSRKRSREDCTSPDTTSTKTGAKTDEDTTEEDSTYNSFQFWRVPLPELDLSLLEDYNDHPQTQKKSKVKDISADTMET